MCRGRPRGLYRVGGLTNRFAVFTGDAIQDVPLADCTEAILATLEQNMHRETAAVSTTVPLDSSEVTEEAIFEIVTGLRAAKNGDKFCRLYDEGDITGYASHSEADAGLCTVIAFRAGKKNGSAMTAGKAPFAAESKHAVEPSTGL